MGKMITGPQPTVGNDGWVEHYGTYTFRLANGMHMQCSLSMDRSDPGYKIHFLGISLKHRIVDINQSKAAAWRLVTRTLTEAVIKWQEVMGKSLLIDS